MKIKSLKLKNYRNYESLQLNLDEETNIFYGDNAQGKTNILEAVYLTGTTKSHRGSKDKDLVRFDRDAAHIEAILEKKGIDYRIDMHLRKQGGKGIAVNRIPIKKASELFGIANYVFFSPEDLNIIKNGPSERRRFLDMELSQLDRIYLDDLITYHKVVDQRNKLLKEISFTQDQKLYQTLDIWDIQLCSYGERIIRRRMDFLKELSEIVEGIHGKLSGGLEHLIITYEPSNGEMSLEEAILRNREKDLKYRNTSVGPHRDDVAFYFGGLDIRRFGSQGQQRTAALSLKLSEIELVKKTIHDTPILLLDDVLSELDKNRQNYLLDSIHDIQTLVTCTGVEDFVNHRFALNSIFQVKQGKVSKKN